MTERTRTADEWRRLFWDFVADLPYIYADGDRLAEWDEQVGKWMADGILPDFDEWRALFRRVLPENAG